MEQQVDARIHFKWTGCVLSEEGRSLFGRMGSISDFGFVRPGCMHGFGKNRADFIGSYYFFIFVPSARLFSFGSPRRL